MCILPVNTTSKMKLR
uniref:Uncharacterized protein n=1 Tax=Anguilla anguilla TaxID=7936 RepID=A0A0E9T8M6_ANGAN